MGTESATSIELLEADYARLRTESANKVELLQVEHARHRTESANELELLKIACARQRTESLNDMERVKAEKEDWGRAQRKEVALKAYAADLCHTWIQRITASTHFNEWKMWVRDRIHE